MLFNSKEPSVENEIQASQCLENLTHNVELQGLRLVQDEKEEEKQLQLQKENEGSFFNWKSLLLGLGVAACAAGIVLYETQGKTEGQFHIDNNNNINCDFKEIYHL